MPKLWNRHLTAALLSLLWPLLSLAQMTADLSVDSAPPDLPVYEQPPLPQDGDVWTPGYWAWSDDDQDYFWVPGTWVPAPEPGYLWTPGFWGAQDAVFFWHPGYWGPHVGFYGGINYGYGYNGTGFAGCFWRGNQLFYNSAVNNIGRRNIAHVYNAPVANSIDVNNFNVRRASYHGAGGARAAPTAAQRAAAQERHLALTPLQQAHEQTARTYSTLRVGANHGVPPIAATARPSAFSGSDVVSARHGGTFSVVHSEAATPRGPQNRTQQPDFHNGPQGPTRSYSVGSGRAPQPQNQASQYQPPPYYPPPGAVYPRAPQSAAGQRAADGVAPAPEPPRPPKPLQPPPPRAAPPVPNAAPATRPAPPARPEMPAAERR